MGAIIIKPVPDKDFYVEWSSIVEAPTSWGTRAEMLEDEWRDYRRAHPHCTPNPGYGPEGRFDRADQTGSSALDYGFGHWDDREFIYEQRGLLPRAQLTRACELLGEDNAAGVWDLLKPFEDETEVRRG